MGVIDMPYSNGKSTTGDVAEILEAKYGIINYFFEQNRIKIMSELEGGVAGAFENYLVGGVVSTDPFLAGTAEIEKMFHEFLTTKQMDHKVPGVPTRASLQGVSSRFKSRRGPPRPSFVDTGLYENSFKAWVSL
jgi:hypothetical protein